MRYSTERVRGFTLLEMLVVLLIVSLVSALLMQGFLYMAGIYGVVDRKQKVMQVNQLSGGWLADSVQGLVNGVDGAAWVAYSGKPFSGTEQGFEGVGLAALTTAGGVVSPLIVEWRLVGDSSGGLSLVYGEQRLGRSEEDRHVVRSWPRASGRFSYYSAGKWYERFPIGGEGARILPDAIRIEVDALRAPLQLIVRPGASASIYYAPRKESF